MIIFLFFFMVSSLFCAQEITIEASNYSKMPLGIILLQENDQLHEFALNLKKHLEFSEQFEVSLISNEQPKNRKYLKDLCQQGYGLVIFLESDPTDVITWRLYDTTQAIMLKGGRIFQVPYLAKELYLAHILWPLMTGQKGPFATKICFVKKEQRNGQQHHIICTANYDGSDVQEIVSSSRICLGLTWNNLAPIPAIMFSEFTRRNVRLMATTLQGSKKAILDKDGTFVGISYKKNSYDVTYGHSGDIWLFQYDQITQKKNRVLLIHEQTPAACPNILSTGDIIYCAHGHIKRWQAADQTCVTITADGYCVSPCVSFDEKNIIYAKKTNKVMQLWIYDREQRHHKQLTFTKGNKSDASYSPCGNYIVYCLQDNKKQQLIIHNLRTHKELLINDGAQGSCPAWSPFFIG